MSLIDLSLSGLSEPGTKLIEKISDAIGVLYEPRTTAAWRLQIVVWQNMSFQSNHPE
ncbi:hypothetical protein OU632_26935 [Escherichia coli]|nr:hypothetical protein [Escherichia coli]